MKAGEGGGKGRRVTSPHPNLPPRLRPATGAASGKGGADGRPNGTGAGVRTVVLREVVGEDRRWRRTRGISLDRGRVRARLLPTGGQEGVPGDPRKGEGVTDGIEEGGG